MRSDLDFFADVVLEQLNRPPERRCPIAQASNEVVELLSEHWAVFAPGCKYGCASILKFVADDFLSARFYFLIFPTILSIIGSCTCTGSQVLYSVSRYDMRIRILANSTPIRMWNESGASVNDFARVAAIVQSQSVNFSVITALYNH